MKYTDKIALVTGANSGIGEAIAHRLASLGCKVYVNGRRESENQRVVEAINANYSTGAISLTGDVADETTCRGMIERIASDEGRLDLLVNNAGTFLSRDRIADSTSEDFDQVLKTNLYSCYWLSREAFRLIEKQPPAEDTELRGAIINIASILGVEAWANAGIYAASKHGMMGLTRAMADEGEAAAIRVAAIGPAMVATAMTGKSGPDYIQPEDIAASVAYLLELSPAAWPTEIVIPRRGSD
ncbi:MAG: SDR family NAD(P)-dependent oxidoreductase [Verrucomicrobia bacterium]|jgi:3-oxoacyl-[acyl-carrier protein] reductase|nr:SDR family NAD(P)-dependent oxidoreductase [Verrucomicrobiota bacterium]